MFLTKDARETPGTRKSVFFYMPKPKKPEPKYNLTVSMNGEVFDCKTDDLKGAFQKLSSQQVQTEAYITIKQGLSDFTKRLTLVNAKKLFRDEESLDIFLSTYHGLYGA